MQRDFSALDAFLEETGVDGYLIDADGESSDQLYLSGFDAPDPFVTLYTSGDDDTDGDGIHLLVSGLEYGRAKQESNAETVTRFAAFDYHAKREEYDQEEAFSRVVSEFFAAHDVECVAVPARFPLVRADGLRDLGGDVTADADDIVTKIRARKTDAEIEKIRAAQAANEAAMSHADGLIREARVDDDGVLHYDDEELTSERVRREIEMELLRRDHALDETIVSCGADAADPHDRGSGPLRAGESIIIDIFPRGKESRYCGDLTRTFVKGEPSAEIQEWYDLTLAANQAALDTIAPGVTGKAVHDAVCDVYEENGEPTLRSDEEAETGFIHSTGHGVGLDVHEQPTLDPGGEELETGHVVTVEPGLYDPAIGGVRIEDLVVVTEDGYENLTTYPKDLIIN